VGGARFGVRAVLAAAALVLVAVPFGLLLFFVRDKWPPLLRGEVAARDGLHGFAVSHRGFVVGGPLAMLLAGLGAWWLAGAALRLVERMRRQAAAIGDRDLGRRLAVPPTRDEMAALGTTM
jgi:HAMP domain